MWNLFATPTGFLDRLATPGRVRTAEPFAAAPPSRYVVAEERVVLFFLKYSTTTMHSESQGQKIIQNLEFLLCGLHFRKEPFT